MFCSTTVLDYVLCPFDKSHRVLKKRLLKHLMKCQVNHPDSELKLCPFNPTHVLSEAEYHQHIANCAEGKNTDYFYHGATCPVTDQQHEPIECDESWDRDNNIDYDPEMYLSKVKVLISPTYEKLRRSKAILAKQLKLIRGVVTKRTPQSSSVDGNRLRIRLLKETKTPVNNKANEIIELSDSDDAIEESPQQEEEAEIENTYVAPKKRVNYDDLPFAPFQHDPHRFVSRIATRHNSTN